MSDPVAVPAPQRIIKIDGREVTFQAGAVHWSSGMVLCADGAPNAYHPTNDRLALDFIANAGRPGNWWGVVTDTGKRDGTPVVQGLRDPMPGFLVSCTALGAADCNARDPRRYVDASSIPYVAVPPELRARGVEKGDLALVVWHGTIAPAIVAEVGPAGKLGEGSIDLARRLGIPGSAKHGGVSEHVTYIVFMGSRLVPRWPHTVDEIAVAAHAAGDAWVRRVNPQDVPDALRGPLAGGPCGEAPAP